MKRRPDLAGKSTFSENWYRVADVRARLRSAVQVHRLHFRGQTCYVVRDPANNKFFRLHSAAYRFMGLLDGRRTVAEAWRASNEQLGDEAVTQDEAVEVLGRLYTADLLAADLPADAEGLFQRYRRRRVRELGGKLANLLSIRIPLGDPDGLLRAATAVAGAAFSKAGLVAWLAAVAAGAAVLWGRYGELAEEGRRMLDGANLLAGIPLLYVAFVLAKGLHELAHGVACKRFGRRSGGEVHEAGIMLLVLAPMPYVDVTAAWALRQRRHRVVVAAAGMMAELALASAAAFVWVHTAGADTSTARTIHALAYNVILVASVATVAFNANPLLRFDGYYILSDVLEIPNLAERSRRYAYWLVKRFAWGVRQAENPAHSHGEAAWLAVYAAASTVFRVWICVKVLLLVIVQVPAVGLVLAVTAAGAWVVAPAGKLVHYLLAGAELERNRGRAVASTAAVVAVLAAALGAIPAPDNWTVEGTVQPVRLDHVYAAADGFVEAVLASGTAVDGRDGNAPPLVRAVNRELETELKTLAAEREMMLARQRSAESRAGVDHRYLTAAQVLRQDLEDLAGQEELLRAELASLELRAANAGTWICPRSESLRGAYLHRGEEVGMVASLDETIIRVQPSQRLAGMLLAEGAAEVRLRAADGRQGAGTWRRLVAVEGKDRKGQKAPSEFRLEIAGNNEFMSGVLSGQTIAVQLWLPRRPLAAQWWRSIRQTLQERLGV